MVTTDAAIFALSRNRTAAVDSRVPARIAKITYAAIIRWICEARNGLPVLEPMPLVREGLADRPECETSRPERRSASDDRLLVATWTSVRPSVSTENPNGASPPVLRRSPGYARARDGYARRPAHALADRAHRGR